MNSAILYTIMFIKNLIVTVTLTMGLVFAFDIARDGIGYIVENYSAMDESLRVLTVCGFAGIVYALTSLEIRLIKWISKHYNQG